MRFKVGDVLDHRTCEIKGAEVCAVHEPYYRLRFRDGSGGPEGSDLSQGYIESCYEKVGRVGFKWKIGDELIHKTGSKTNRILDIREDYYWVRVEDENNACERALPRIFAEREYYLKAAAVPKHVFKFAVGDKVEILNNRGPVVHCFGAGDICTVVALEPKGSSAYPGHDCYVLEGDYDGGPVTQRVRVECVRKPEVRRSCAPAPADDGKALRYNTDKPKLSYILAFRGGVGALFGLVTTERYGLEALARWYQGGDTEDLVGAIDSCLEQLGAGWESDLARVSMFGEQKYVRGNFLKGRTVSDTCDSLLRHLVALLINGEETDPDSKLPHRGHIAWNLLFLGHCAEEDRFDDRLFKELEK